jgi:hypothetical protein
MSRPIPDNDNTLPPIIRVYTDHYPSNGNNGGTTTTINNSSSSSSNSTPSFDNDKLASISTLLQNDLPIQDRTYKLQLYPSCFIGSEAVDLLVQHGVVTSRSEAVDVLQTLMTNNEGGSGVATFEHVTERMGVFVDDYQFYHFVKKTESNGDDSIENDDDESGQEINGVEDSKKNKTKESEPKLPIMDKYGFLIEDKKRFMEMPSSISEAQADKGGGGGDMMELDKWYELLDNASSSTLFSKDKKKTTTPTSLLQPTTKLQDKLKHYTRKGLPDSVRQRVWTVFTGVDQIRNNHRMKQQQPGEYIMLLQQADFEWNRWQNNIHNNDSRRSSIDHGGGFGGTSVSEMSGLTNPDPELEEMEEDVQLAEYKNKRPCHTVLEQIERDICRTFPNHYLFQTVREEEEEEEKVGTKGDIDIEPSNSAESGAGGNNAVADEIKRELNSMVEKMNCGPSTTLTNVDGISVAKIGGGMDNNNTLAEAKAADVVDSNSTITPSSSRLSERGDGQGALRRVLRAYSQYDSEVGYCQGMNFIVAMFLTFLTEEESFWLLVIVMNEEPYMLRALYGEDMSGTHEILYIADKLMKQFVPKLWKHLEREGIHHSMFVTQWLLTLYTSSFPFDLVSRVWDSFLVEGWKVIYRVMLGLLKHAEPTLLEMPFEQILMFLRDYPTMIDGQTIMRESLQIGLKRKHVQKYVNAWRLANPTEAGPSRFFLSRKDSHSHSSWTNDSNSEGKEPSKKVKSGSKFPIQLKLRKKVEKDVIIEDLAPKLLPIVGSTKFAVLIHNALTPAECKQMIERAEKGGFEDASIYDRRSNRIHRNCKRWYEDDPALAENWYDRILKALDDSALEYKIRNAPWMGTRYNALPIRSVGLNERLRVLKYNQGEYFGSHCDTKFVRGPNYSDKAGETSHVSVHVYLNEKFKGGQTRFHGGGRHYDVKPKTGSILIFDHNLLHQGVVIKAGKKYVVRTDVMYRAMRTRGDEMSSISGFPDVIGLGLRQTL